MGSLPRSRRECRAAVPNSAQFWFDASGFLVVLRRLDSTRNSLITVGRNRIRVGDHDIRLIDRERHGVRIDQPPVGLTHPTVAEGGVVGLRVAGEDFVIRVELMSILMSNRLR